MARVVQCEGILVGRSPRARTSGPSALTSWVGRDCRCSLREQNVLIAERSATIPVTKSILKSHQLVVAMLRFYEPADRNGRAWRQRSHDLPTAATNERSLKAAQPHSPRVLADQIRHKPKRRTDRWYPYRGRLHLDGIAWPDRVPPRPRAPHKSARPVFARRCAVPRAYPRTGRR